jgi:AcrR family transcriptional regulator
MTSVIVKFKKDPNNPMPAGSRERMIQSATLLIRERGLAGTSFRDVVEHSGAPRGSIYHHFPRGKTQLAEETVNAAAAFVETVIARAARNGDPLAALRLFVEAWRHTLESTDFRAGCPVMAIATEAGEDEPQLAQAAAAAFECWRDGLAASLCQAGATPAKARRTATLAVAAVEGAVVMCRAARSTRPLLDVAQELEQSLRDALPAAR